MTVNHQAVRLKFMACLILVGAFLSACQKKNEVPVPVAKAKAMVEPAPRAAMDSPRDTSQVASVDTAKVNPPVMTSPSSESVRKPGFVSHPMTKAFPGRPFQYRPSLSILGPFQLRIVKGPDSMQVVKGQVLWMPIKEGHYPVVLEAVLVEKGGAKASLQQTFVLNVDKVLELALKPLPVQVNKGDTVTFDLRGSVFPAWAAADITVRFDYDGDGKWDGERDGEGLPLAANLVHRKVFDMPGRFRPKVEARYKDLEIKVAEGAITVVSAVTAILKVSPDTVEPGGTIAVDASGSKGDGRLVFSLDLNGDGASDWIDSTTGKAELKAPASGVYQAMLTARNPMGQEGKASATVRVNALPKLELKVKNPKENMAAEVEIRAHAKDADDSLARARINFTGDTSGWILRTAPPDSQISPKDWLLRFRHAYGKVGKYTVKLCIASADGREACQSAPIEIFNAPPICKPGADIHATVGKPMEIDGDGIDPDGKIVKWEWDLNGDGKFDLVSVANGKFRYTFAKKGVFPLVLRVTTADGMTATGSRKVEVKTKW